VLQVGRSWVRVSMRFSNFFSIYLILPAVPWRWFTQPLTEMSTRRSSGGKTRPARKADNLTGISDQTFYTMRDPLHLTTL
jgi:hypothetical protein